MRHVILAVLFGVFCGIVSVEGIDIYMRTDAFWGLVALLVSFLAAFNLTMTTTILLGFIPTRNSPFAKKSHVHLSWAVITLIGIWLIVVPALRGD